MLFCAAVLSITLCASALGQAIVLDQRQMSLGLDYQHTLVRWHVTSDGTKFDFGHIMTNTTRANLSYGLTDRLTLDATVPLISAKFISFGGTFPRGPHGPSDDGTFHATLQDFHLGLRANLMMNPFVATPFIQVTIPSHHYQLEGHTAVGRGNLELTFGTWVGRDLGPLLPNAFVEAMASHTVAQRTRVAGVESQRLNRTNGSLELGYYVTPSVTLRAFGTGLRTLGGWDVPRPLGPVEKVEHDRFVKDKDIQLGAAVSYNFQSGIGVYGGYFTTVWSRNAHTVAGPMVGLSWSPRPHQAWLAHGRSHPALLLAQQ